MDVMVCNYGGGGQLLTGDGNGNFNPRGSELSDALECQAMAVGDVVSGPDLHALLAYSAR